MATIAEIKKQYPQYANIPDKELADALYDKYYSKESKGDFYKAVGYNESWKEALGRGVDNLKKESQDPLNAVKNLGLGIAKGGSDIIDGSAQLLARGAAATSGYVAPGSSVDQFLQQELKNTEAFNQDREDRYQKATNGSVLAGVGRVGGNAVVPLGGVSKVAEAATLPSKIMAGAKVGALSGAVQPVYDMDQPGANFALNKTGQVATGVAAGSAAPIVSRVAREAAAATGKVVDNPLARIANDSLIKDRQKILFGNSVNPAADAQIIQDLATLKADPLRFQQVAGGQAAVGRSTATGIGGDYKEEVLNLMKQAGMKDDQITNLLNKNVITSADIASLPNTPAGKAAANALTLAVRADAMTKPVPSSSLLSPVRAAVDWLPIPRQIGQGINAALGGRTTGENAINKLTTPRNVAAAERTLANGSPADAIGNFETVIQKAMAQKATEAEAKAAQEAVQAGALKEANIAGMRMNRAPAGGAFQSLKQYTGMADDEIVDALRVLSNHPTLGKYADQIRQGGNTDNGALFAVQNAINGIQKRQGGILNQSAPGALSQGTVTVEGIRNPISYAANVKNAEEAVKLARDSAFKPELGQFATTVAGVKAPADKLALIQERLAKASDPAEIDYINKFVLPLANFGKK